MRDRMFKLAFGSVIGLAIFISSYFVVGTDLGKSISGSVKTFCLNPKEDRIKLQDTIAKALEGNKISIYCVGD